MSHQFDTMLKAHIAVLIAAFWVFAAVTPFVVSTGGVLSELEFLFLFVAIAIYPIYTGVRAWKRNWTARFVLRIVVPAALFVAGWVAVGLISWLK